MHMTDEQRGLYLANDGQTCPYCESDNIGPNDYAMECQDCGERWVNIVRDGKIVNVQEA